MVQKSIGTLLKERRTALGWSLADAEKKTAIKKIYISALETDNHSVFPGEFYMRAYLKQYSEKLELDTMSLLAAFDENRDIEVASPLDETGNYRFVRPDERVPEAVSADNDESEDSEDSAREKEVGRFRRYLPLVSLTTIAALIVIGVILVIVFTQQNNQNLTPKDYTVATSSQSSESASNKAQTTFSTSQSGNTLTVNVSSNANPAVLSFSLKNDAARTSVSLTNSNIPSLTLSNANPSATVSLNADAAQSTLTLGLANTTDITINGQPLNLSAQATTLSLNISYAAPQSTNTETSSTQ